MDAATRENLIKTHSWIKSELDTCISFWSKNAPDKVHGGIFTCLTREGQVYSTDKSVWMQGRAAWTYSWLCKNYGQNSEWLDIASSCLDFMESHCINRDAGIRMYFTVTEDGKPLRQRRYNFSEGFYTIANAEYYGITGTRKYLERARDAYKLIYDLNHGLEDPTGLGPKTIPETRTGRALANPMIFLNITSIMRRVDPDHIEIYDKHAQECADEIIKYHFKPELKCTLESVGPNGEFQSDFSAGRVVNPGHDIECSWFLLEEAIYQNNDQLRDLAATIFRYAIEGGWDHEYGGLLYFTDCLGYPPESYEHDMKLWWPHNEILIASLMLYQSTNDTYYFDWFMKTVDYCSKYFSDPEHGEWFGYLRRDGKPTAPPCKGSTFKGPFHLPRALVKVDKILTEILK